MAMLNNQMVQGTTEDSSRGLDVHQKIWCHGDFDLLRQRGARRVGRAGDCKVVTLWLFNTGMENGPLIDDFPIKTSIYKGFFHGYIKCE